MPENQYIKVNYTINTLSAYYDDSVWVDTKEDLISSENIINFNNIEPV